MGMTVDLKDIVKESMDGNAGPKYELSYPVLEPVQEGEGQRGRILQSKGQRNLNEEGDDRDEWEDGFSGIFQQENL